MPSANEPPLEIDVVSVAALQQQEVDFLLLDVRERDEYELARIEGSTLIPMTELGDRIDELEPHRERRIVVHCHHGGRSMQVTEALRRHGFAEVQNMDGGIDRWSLQVDPDVPRY